MSKNTGVTYEKLTQQIFQAILDQDQVKNIKVQHNVKLKGKELDHQIDVYWEYELGGIIYRAVVQAKDWGQAVTQLQLLAFRGILDDLPGQPRGIFVTRSGYQSGAEKFAKTNGILIYELRQPEEDDLKGRIANMTLKATIFAPVISDVQVVADEAWLSEERVKRGLSPETAVPLHAAEMTDQLTLANEHGADLGNVRKVLISMFKACNVANTPTPCSHSFDKPTFLNTGVPEFPVLKLAGIKATILNQEGETHTSYSTPEGVVAFILKNIIDDRMEFFTDKVKPITIKRTSAATPAKEA